MTTPPLSGPVVPTAFVDANVLYPSELRSFLLYLHRTGAFRVRWSDRVHEEWTEALLRRRPDISREKLLRTRSLMEGTAPDALVTGYEDRIASLHLPDPHDRHILAAAIHYEADVIVTINLRDFPPAAVEPHGIVVMHPDQFTISLWHRFSELVVDAARDHRSSLQNPPRSQLEYLKVLAVQGMVETAAILEFFDV
ncbi:MAG: PIN domain-containing protein [Bryobacteraceae bacterium]